MAIYEIDNSPTPIDFQENNILTRTLQNAKNLLMCHMGEVPFDRYRGFDVSLYDLPIPAFNEELMPELDRLMIYEPDITVKSAKGSLLEDGSIYVKVTVECQIANSAETEEGE